MPSCALRPWPSRLVDRFAKRVTAARLDLTTPGGKIILKTFHPVQFYVGKATATGRYLPTPHFPPSLTTFAWVGPGAGSMKAYPTRLGLLKLLTRRPAPACRGSFDFTVVLRSKRDGNNRQRMNRQVLPVKQFHVGRVTYNCEDAHQASARLASHIAVNSPDSNCFARSLPVSCRAVCSPSRNNCSSGISRTSHGFSNLSIVGAACPFSNQESRQRSKPQRRSTST